MSKFLGSIEGYGEKEPYRVISPQAYAGGSVRDGQVYSRTRNALGMNEWVGGDGNTYRAAMDGRRVMVCYPGPRDMDSDTHLKQEAVPQSPAFRDLAAGNEVLRVSLEPDSGPSLIKIAEGFYVSNNDGVFVLATIFVERTSSLDSDVLLHQVMFINTIRAKQNRPFTNGGGMSYGPVQQYEVAGFYDVENMGRGSYGFETIAVYPRQITYKQARMAMELVESGSIDRKDIAGTGFVLASKYFSDTKIDPIERSIQAMSDKRFSIRSS